MDMIKKFLALALQRSTLALVGAFLIHLTLGNIYTLSNVNSYLTSYMRLNGLPTAAYSDSVFISASYAIGQGSGMVLGGILEGRFSARLICISGCSILSISVASTSLSIKLANQLAILFTYGLLPGFGAGLAYMTPISNGFRWYPERKGFVAGVILGGLGLGAFIFNPAQTAFVNPQNLSPPPDADGYFTQESILQRVPGMFSFIGAIYACFQFIGCCLMFAPNAELVDESLEAPILASHGQPLTESSRVTLENAGEFCEHCESKHCQQQQNGTITNRARNRHFLSLKQAVSTREFIVLFVVYGISNQGVLFVNAMLKEFAQMFIKDDMFLAWAGSASSLANSLGRITWGLAIDRYSFTQCFTASTLVFGSLMFAMPFEVVLSSKILYLICTIGIYGSFSSWKATYPVHLSRVFGIRRSGMIYGMICASQSIGALITAYGISYLVENYSRYIPFHVVTLLESLGLVVYHVFYPKSM